MKKLLVVLALAGISFSAMAQDSDPVLKNSVVTNSFWSNWFVQVGGQWDVFYPSQSNFGSSKSPVKSFRTSPEVAVAIGKWFSPEMGFRVKGSGIWGKRISGKDASEKYKFWSIQAQPVFNLSNIFCGYNPSRIYNLSLFGGAGVARNMSNNIYSMSLGIGLLNQFYVCEKLAVNLELGWNYFEPKFDGDARSVGKRVFDSHDNILYAEVGVTYNIGKTGWSKAVSLEDYEALSAEACAKLAALRSQLKAEQDENARLRAELAKWANHKCPEPTGNVTAGSTSVFFDLNSAKINSKKDLINLEAIAAAAKNTKATVVVRGSADSKTGSSAYNQKLSESRAQAVADELVSLGVDRAKIQVSGVGGVAEVEPFNLNRRAIVTLK